MDDIRDLLYKRILILDGAMGTMLQRNGLSGNSESFNFTRPEVISSIHRAYIDAGADIIETNSFSANRISQSEYGCSDRAYEMALQAARLARKAADEAPRKVWVAGSVGPTSKSLTLAQDISDPAFRQIDFDEMASAYEEQLRGLIEGGADIILLETCFDALNAKAAVYALETIAETSPSLRRPLMISATVSDRSGRTLTGQTMEAFYRSVGHAAPLSFGLNCSLGAEELAPLARDVASWAECAVSLYPNAGLPNEMGNYDQTPAEMSAQLGALAREGLLNIVGGCCGTTPEHIAAISAAVRDCPCRPRPKASDCLHVSGLEAVTIDRSRNFTNIAERTNVAGSRKFARLIASGDYAQALEAAAAQLESGASIMDVNMDDAMLDSCAEMEKFLRHVSNEPSVARAAIMVDSSHWDTIRAGLKNAQGKCIVNSISLREGEESFLMKAREARKLGAAVVVMAFDEQGQATSFGRKTEICARAYRLLTERLGFRPCDIIFDPGVLSVGTGIAEHSRYAVDFIESVRWIKAELPGALTSGGISNLSFAFRGNNEVREAMHSVFLYHAIAAGLDMGIVNPAMLKVYDEIEPELLKCVSDVILDSDPGATERLIDMVAIIRSRAERGKDAGAADKATAPEDGLPAGERLEKALVNGGSASLRDDVLECLAITGKAVDVIEGTLMAGMAAVGERFAGGRMFLPQVVKSAKVMRDAVDILQPYLEEGGQDDSAAHRRPLVLLATVKGDVHDIGKNIVGIVMRCNGFEVQDMGVMVPAEAILDKAAELRADIIGVSGLITPSLSQMEALCREMSARGMDTPLIVGGATTSALHTAVRLAPLYGHVFYGADASSSAVLAGRLVSSREECERLQHEEQEKLRRLYLEAHSGRKSVAAVPAPFPSGTFLRGKFFDDMPVAELDIREVLPYFDWRLFYTSLGIRERQDEAAVKLNADAVAAIDRMVRERRCRIMLGMRFDACRSDGGEIICESYRLPMLRQPDGQRRSLCDFVAPVEYGFGSPAGMFAVSVHAAGAPPESGYDALMERAARVTLAEAASSWIDGRLKRKLPQDTAARIIKPAAGYASCPDHSLKRDILRLIPDSGKLGISLTESCAMSPDASICGLIFVHPDAFYPEIRGIDAKTAEDYARRRNMSASGMELFLGSIIV